MLKKILLASIVLSILYGCTTANQVTTPTAPLDLPAGMSLVETVDGQNSDKIVIPYSKYRLDNGLTVILHQDESDPLVHVDVTYHVGSAREEFGKSGFAHFFEHMMFQGSENVADDEHFRIITEAGGEMNGTTNSDRTNYYQTVPANQLEKVLWLESDRMGFLLEAVTQEKFEIQRETVKNERGQNYDNQPYGLRSERNSEALYPVGHPYSWSTIGYVEDLERVSVEDLKAFFKRWYGPNNAVLTIGGDIDVRQTLNWVNKYFGSIPAGPAVEKAPKTPVTLDSDRYITLEDEVYLPLIQVTFPTVHVRHQDEAPLDVLSEILGGGKTSLFYKNLVKDNHAVQALVSHPCRELACEFQLIALANPQKTADLGSLYNKIQATLEEFEQRGVNQDDLNRTKAGIESSTIFGLQSVSGKVSTLASNQIFDGNPDMVQYDLDRYSMVTVDDVNRVFNTYIKDKPRVVLSIVPQGQTQLAAKQSNFTVPSREFDVAPIDDEVSPVNITDNFDRSVRPQAGETPEVKVPQYTRLDFDNGIELLAHQTKETPTVTLLLSMEGGPLLDPIDKAGLAAFTAQMMNESTKLSSNEELANQLALLGSQISFSASGRGTQVRVTSLTKHLDETLDLLEQKFFQPAFLQEDFERIKQSLLQQFQQRLKNPSFIAQRGVDLVLFGKNNRIAIPDSGTVDTLQNIQLNDVKSFYQQYYSPALADLVIVGDIPESEIVEHLGFLKNWRGPDYSIPGYNDFPEYQSSKIYFIDKPDAAQSIVRIVKRSLPYDATGTHFKSKLMNFPLGGMFNSRINLNLREDKGFTYGASSQFVGGKTLGYFQAGADLNKQNSGEGLSEILKEIEQYRKMGMNQGELALMRSAYTQSEALSYETPYNKATFLAHLLTYDLDRSYRQVQSKIIENVSLQELNSLASEMLDTADMQIVVVGDADAVLPQLSELELDIVELSITD